jgi:hypothetical protein
VSGPHTDGPYPEPAWLSAKVDQKLALMSEVFSLMPDKLVEKSLSEYDTMLTPLTEPKEGATPADFERWDSTCDNCGAYCPGTLFTGQVLRLKWNTKIIFMFGVCKTCKVLT